MPIRDGHASRCWLRAIVGVLTCCVTLALIATSGSVARASQQDAAAATATLSAADPLVFAHDDAIRPLASPQASGPATVAITPASATTQSGAAVTYTLTVSCSVSGGCNATSVSFPSTAITGDGATTDFGSWIGASSCAGVTKTVSSGQVTFAYGNVPTGTMQCTFTVTPPEYLTLNNTQVTITPTISGSNFASSVGDPATLTVTAGENDTISKSAPGSVATGGQFSYTVGFYCGTPGTAYKGDVGLSALTITDQLPSGFTYTSVSQGNTTNPLPGSFNYDPSTQTLTYSDPTGASCQNSKYDGGPNGNNELVFRINGTASSNGTADTIGTKVCNTASSNFTYLDGTTAAATSSAACATVTALVPQPFLSKAADTTSIPNAGQYRFPPDGKTYPITYPGQWDGSATTISYQLRMYTNATAAGADFALEDPVPCLDNYAGRIYSSNAPGNDCAHPAFIPTLVTVYTGFTATASDQITLDYADGTTGTVAYTPGTGWVIPTSKPVAEIDFPQFPEEGNNTTTSGNPMEINVNGYADPTAAPSSLLQNTVTGDAYQVGSSTTLAPEETKSASVMVVSPDEPSGTIVRPQIQSAYNGTGTCKETIGWATYGGVGNEIEVASGPSQAIYVDYLAPAGAAVTAGQSSTFSFREVHAVNWYQDLQSGTFSGGQTYTTATLTATATSNYQGSGRTLYEWVIPAGTITQPGDYFFNPSNLTVDLGAGCAGTFENDVTVGYGAPVTGCFYGGLAVPVSEGAPPVNPSADGDLDSNGVGSGDYCGYSSPLTVSPVNPGFRVDKTVQGDLDPGVVAAGGTGTVGASGGGATYDVTFTNTGQSNLTNPVMYDILPAVGDTQASSLAARGSQWAVTLTGVGPLPPNVTVSYSQSANPCRPEVLASDPGCTNDWTTTPPAPLSAVRALKFAYTGSVVVNGAIGTNSFTIPFTVSTPSAAGGLSAWNTVGTNADAGGSLIGAAESSRTGLQTLSGPTITKASSTPSYTAAGDKISYTYTVANNTGVTLTGVGITDNLVSAPASDTAPQVGCQSLSSPTGSCTGATATLAPNQSATFVATYTATQADVDAGSLSDTATVSAQPPSGPAVTNTSARVTVPAQQSPAVSLVKRATVTPAADQSGAKLGDTIAYTYRVTNSGNTTLRSVAVNDPALGPVTCPTPAGSGLAVGDAETCTADGTYTVTQADVDRGHIDDSATAGCVDVAGNPCATSSPSSVTVPAAPATPSVSIHKLAHASDGDGTPLTVGETIAYSYLVTNTGNVTLAEVSVDDPTLGSVSCPSPAAPGLAPGGSETCTGDQHHTVTQSDVDHGAVTDTATASCTDIHGIGCPTSAPSTVRVPATPAPRVSIVKRAAVTPAADQQRARVGDSIAYSYVVTNAGNVDLTSVAVSDPTLGAVSCPTPAPPGLAPGASETCSGDARHLVSAHDSAAGKVTDTATASGTDELGDVSSKSEPSTVIVPVAPVVAPVAARLEISKRVNHRIARLGQTLSYTIVVANHGPGTATHVTIRDRPSLAMTFTRAGISHGRCRLKPSVRCTVGEVKPGGTVTIHLVGSAARSGIERNAATVSAANIKRSSTAKSTAATRILPALRLSKTASVRAAMAGEDVTYTVRIADPGPTAIGHVHVCDTLPARLVFVRSGPRAHLTGGRWCWTIRRLRARRTRVFTLTANVAPGPRRTVVNHATATVAGITVARASARVRVSTPPHVGCSAVPASSAAARSGRPGRAHSPPIARIAC